jgi:formylglycine-generating enzyme
MLCFSKDSLRQQVEAASGGKVTVLYDDKNYPSYMVVVPKFRIQDVAPEAGSGVHPAFICGGVEKSELFIAQYPALVVDSRACSFPGVDPTTSIGFETARTRCSSKGVGWHLMSNAEWAALALWSHAALGADKVHGNTNYGQDYSATYEAGLRQDGVAPGTVSGPARTFTGSGPSAWRHDGTIVGISDLVGNIWEWVAGLRIVDGEIQIIQNNDAVSADHGISSAAWKAILEDGSLVTPGTPNTLKWNASGVGGTGNPVLAKTISSQSDGSAIATRAYKDLTASAVTPPDVLKQLCLYPHKTDMERGSLWAINAGERLPFRGGVWNIAENAGLYALTLTAGRIGDSSVGFRPVFVL